jgi:hypothetical protein
MAVMRDGTYVNTITKPGGRKIAYLRVSAGPQRDRYVHQLVAEAMLGRPLAADEEVDHEDQNTLNNDWRNLKVKTTTEHTHTTNRRMKERRIAARLSDAETCLAEDRADRLMEDARVRDVADGY